MFQYFHSTITIKGKVWFCVKFRRNQIHSSLCELRNRGRLFLLSKSNTCIFMINARSEYVYFSLPNNSETRPHSFGRLLLRTPPGRLDTARTLTAWGNWLVLLPVSQHKPRITNFITRKLSRQQLLKMAQLWTSVIGRTGSWCAKYSATRKHTGHSPQVKWRSSRIIN